MLRTLCVRICLTLINILFPPLTVYLITGASMDTVINCFFFLLAVIPSHVHGFYLSCVYFSRKNKARKGRWPGAPHAFIHSEKVNNGGLTNAEVEERYYAEKGLRKSQVSGRSSNSTRARPEQRRTTGRPSSLAADRPHLPQRRTSGNANSASAHVARQDSQRQSYHEPSVMSRPRRSSSAGSAEPSERMQRRSRLQSTGIDATGSAPVRQRPMMTVK